MPSPRPLEGKVAVLTDVSRPGQVGESVARSLAESGSRRDADRSHWP